MCDTLGFINNNRAVFGKNSDRSPNEPQVMEFHPAASHPDGEIIQATYIRVPQVKETRAVLLSRPTWLWGAEIGMNECGVCIGNEAVWTLGKYGKSGLTGMDLLRLALERSEDADSAVIIITSLLEQYGQGGNCGYDHDFYYDNSYLIMDRQKLVVLETAGKDWTWKQYDRASISNRLSIGSDADAYSGSPCNFAGKHTEHLYNIASGSAGRRGMTACSVKNAASAEDIMAALRAHKPGVKPFVGGTVASPCMHFGGLVGDHTTASMVVDMAEGDPIIWTTGCSLPCVSLYKPMAFGASSPAVKKGEEYWRKRERFNRSLIGKEIPADFYAERDALEKAWLRQAESGISDELTEKCYEEESAFYDKWSRFEFVKANTSAGFMSRWVKKNEAFVQT